MELKTYQTNALEDLEDFYAKLHETGDPSKAFRTHWENKGYNVGKEGIRSFVPSVKGCPSICIKVPTGGGKTYIAACSIKKFFDIFPRKKMAVVWLVPSDSILEQTLRALRNPSHPYRQRLNADFSNDVEVYNVEELLSGQNFNPTALSGQLSIYVLSYDVLRARNKDTRRMYRPNTVMQNFDFNHKYVESPIENADLNSIMVGLYDLSPLVILDESHNAGSSLSIEMLENLNPSMIMEMTATPLPRSNVVSFVTASQLKKENMVKIPVILYGRDDTRDVIRTARDIRNELERVAIKEEANGGQYIRPIVLFQAQPKNADNIETYDHIKNSLVNKYDIPEDQIAIKTSKINEIRNVDLLSKGCRIRYIITVNALKEGWDCPFAYILASLANKNSAVDVEQIVGRILRQPYAIRCKAPELNTSYVLTSSHDFQVTIRNVGLSLEIEGFSKKDFRVATKGSVKIEDFGETEEPKKNTDDIADTPNNLGKDDDSEDFSHIDDAGDHNSEGSDEVTARDLLEGAAKEEEKVKEKADVGEEDTDEKSGGGLEMYENKAKIKPEFKGDVDKLLVPVFLKTKKSGFDDEFVKIKLTKDSLFEGFDLTKCDSNITFDMAHVKIGKMDIDSSGEGLNYKSMEEEDRAYFNKTFQQTVNPEGPEVTKCINDIVSYLKDDCISDGQLRRYVEPIIRRQSIDEINLIRRNVGVAARIIQIKINELKDAYYEESFYNLLDRNKITCGCDSSPYKFPSSIVLRHKESPYAKSLYDNEEAVDGFEAEIREIIDRTSNVKWWHRIRHRVPGEFFINGFKNHYPDFVVMTNRGTLVFIEAKGVQLDGTDSEKKASMSEVWDRLAGEKFKYFMVFKTSNVRIEKMITTAQLGKILDEL